MVWFGAKLSSLTSTKLRRPSGSSRDPLAAVRQRRFTDQPKPPLGVATAGAAGRTTRERGRQQSGWDSNLRHGRQHT
ncbi:hypothetical protein ACWDKQ_01175 [Saccharopolyspora sp. NPDC000995]